MIYDAIDIQWEWDGDFAVGRDGDLKDTSDDLLRALTQEIQSIIKSKFGDWKVVPQFAASLHEFRGEPNTRTNGEAIRNRVISVLTSHDVVKRADLDVRIVPVHAHQVLVLIKVLAVATPDNNLKLGQPVVLSFVYDSVEDSVFYVVENRLERNHAFRGVG
jgi:hypothetical protein